MSKMWRDPKPKKEQPKPTDKVQALAEATRKEELKAAMGKLRQWVEDNGPTS